MLVEILFWVFAALLVAAALAMIMVRNPVHSALLLVSCFFTSASIWLLIEAEFLAIVLTRIHEYHMEHRGENIMSKDKLLAVGERYDALISADKAADAAYR